MTPFAACLALVLKHEGGWSDKEADPGGATMQGVTLATYGAWLGHPATKDELRAISDIDRDTIYRQRYWQPICGDSLPLPLAMVTMDAAVNSGVHKAAQWLQEAVEVTPDGSIGPATIGAAKACDLAQAVRTACMRRLQFLRTLETWETFGDGWGARVADTEKAALAAIGA